MVSRTKESAPARDWLSVAARYSPSGHGRHRVLSVAVGRITYCSTQSHVRIAIFRFHLSSFTHCRRVCDESKKQQHCVRTRTAIQTQRCLS